MRVQQRHAMRPVVIAASILLAGGGAFALFAVLSDNGTTASAAPPVPAEGEPLVSVDYPTNEAGQTYGSLADAPSDEEAPDLIAVELEDGSTGYILKEDLFEAEIAGVNSPADAIALEEERASTSQRGVGGSGESVPAIPVYDQDGELSDGETWGGVGSGI